MTALGSDPLQGGTSTEGDPVESLLEVLSLASTEARTTEDIFTGISLPMPYGRVYGGQVLAQAVVAASRTMDADRPIHSMHGYFLRAGDSSKGITFSVDRLRDGRSFSARRTQAFQEGVPIFSMIASFQTEDDGLEHVIPAPDVPGPDEISSPEGTGVHPMSRRRFGDLPIEVRHVEGSLYGADPVAPQPRQAVWVRSRREMPDDPLLHRAALAYLSDMTIQESILRAHGLTWMTPGGTVASLDHAMWWHRPVRVDDWLLYVQESPTSRGGRGLATGRIYTRDGDLVASVAQEVMVRAPKEILEERARAEG
ncbi:acyl-CoA thioesterase II [Microbacterium sp. cx-59]|uniref:acyl-CoA thioesterase n=1 Tax=Microbacterium sp. cx-59 TaxID=2891207 RepID=UPI001E627820|nr:acyl-CoA thioesterase II [Microbacterium sp. cx-59]MCC4907169.1 acyl-CoA thioesterase II [Microbacterium sp. cx-59]